MATTVKVKAELSKLTDGRERFAGREGTIDHRAPIGKILKVGEDADGNDINQHFDAAYEVRFEDGDEATFLSNELEGEDLIEHVPSEDFTPPTSGKTDGGSATEKATVVEVSE